MNKNIDACLSSNSDDWKTPSWLFNLFIGKGYIDLFPYKSTENQFDKTYMNERLYINPPFSKLNKVIDYVIDLFYRNNKIALLMPVRTDTRYFHKLFDSCCLDMTILFIKGRLHFNDCPYGAPFPCMLVLLGFNNFECNYYCVEQKDIANYVE